MTHKLSPAETRALTAGELDGNSSQADTPLIVAFIDMLRQSAPAEEFESLETLRLVVAFLLQKGVPLQGILTTHFTELEKKPLSQEALFVLLDTWVEEFSEVTEAGEKVVGLANVRRILVRRPSVHNQLSELNGLRGMPSVKLQELPNPRRKYQKRNAFIPVEVVKDWLNYFVTKNQIDQRLVWQLLTSDDELRTPEERVKTVQKLQAEAKKRERIEAAKALQRMLARRGFSSTESAASTPTPEATPMTEKQHRIQSWLRIRDWYIVNSTKQSFIPVAEMFKFFKEQGIPLPDGVQSKDALIKIVEAMKGETTVQGTVVNKMCIHGYEVGYPHGGSYIIVIERKNVEKVLEQLVPEL